MLIDMERYTLGQIRLIHGECIEVMDKLIAEGVNVDAIITDPPYGTTACKWDSVIPFDAMWPRLKALRKDRAPVVLFGSEPFSSALRMSNIREFKYDWFTIKSKPTGHLNAKKQPLRTVESISVFYAAQCLYIPQGLEDCNVMVSRTNRGNYGECSKTTKQTKTGYPRQHIETQSIDGVHQTQKPVALMEYLIKTYTQEGQTVLDFTMGSGTTGAACKNTGRAFIGIELDDKYFDIATERIG